MLTNFQNPFSDALSENVQTEFALWNAACAATIHNFEQLMTLNLGTAKKSIEDGTLAAKELLAAKDPQEWLTLRAAQMQPRAEKALAYNQQLVGIVAGAQSELNKIAQEQFTEISGMTKSLFEGFSSNSPENGNAALDLWKSAFENANAGYAQLTQIAQKSSEAIGEKLNEAAKAKKTAQKPAGHSVQ